MIDNTTRQLAQCAKDEVETVLRSLHRHNGARSRPTLMQIGAMIDSLENAKRFTAAVLSSDKA